MTHAQPDEHPVSWLWIVTSSTLYSRAGAASCSLLVHADCSLSLANMCLCPTMSFPLITLVLRSARQDLVVCSRATTRGEVPGWERMFAWTHLRSYMRQAYICIRDEKLYCDTEIQLFCETDDIKSTQNCLRTSFCKNIWHTAQNHVM